MLAFLFSPKAFLISIVLVELFKLYKTKSSFAVFHMLYPHYIIEIRILKLIHLCCFYLEKLNESIWFPNIFFINTASQHCDNLM